MRNFWLVFMREVVIRVRKKSFIIGTILTPFLFVALSLTPSLIMMLETDTHYTVGVADRTGRFVDSIEETPLLSYCYIAPGTAEDYRGQLATDTISAIVDISLQDSSYKAQLYSPKTASTELASRIKDAINGRMRNLKLRQHNVEGLEQIIRDVNSKIDMTSIVLSQDGGEKRSNADFAMFLGMMIGIIMMTMITSTGGVVMAGVVEEKTSRIAEVLLSTVKPFHLLTGKTLGIASVVILQMIIWVIFTSILISIASVFMPSVSEAMSAGATMGMAGAELPPMAQGPLGDIFAVLMGLNLPLLISGILAFFLFGYLMYATMFAAVGAAVNDASEAGQLQFPLMLPLILSMMIAMMVGKTPDGAIVFWTSIFPLTSPVIMPARLVYGVPTWELVLSLVLLVGSMVAVMWLATRIYSQGLLRYGSKFTWKDLLRLARKGN